MSTKPPAGDVRERRAKGESASHGPFTLVLKHHGDHVIVAGDPAEFVELVRHLREHGGSVQDLFSVGVPFPSASPQEDPVGSLFRQGFIDRERLGLGEAVTPRFSIVISTPDFADYGVRGGTVEHAPRDSSQQANSTGTTYFSQIAESGAKMVAEALEALRVSFDAKTEALDAAVRELIDLGQAAQLAPVPSHAKPNPAALELQAMRERMGIRQTDAGQDDAQVQAMHVASEAAKKAWIDDGLLIGSTEMSKAWARSRQALDLARGRGEVFAVKVANRLWYPASFAPLPADHVKAVCLALRPVEPVAKFIFWQRPHGALRGRTIPEALRQGDVERATQVAEAFKREQLRTSAVGRLNDEILAARAEVKAREARASTKRAPARKIAAKYRAPAPPTSGASAPSVSTKLKRAVATPVRRGATKNA